MNNYPSDWSIDRIKDVAAINAASLPSDTDPDYGFDYLEISNVNYYGIIDKNAIEQLRYEEAPSRARPRVGMNDTVISSVRPNLQAVAFCPDRHGDFVCLTGFNVIHANGKQLFLYQTGQRFLLFHESRRLRGLSGPAGIVWTGNRQAKDHRFPDRR